MKILKINKKLVFVLGKMALVITLQNPSSKILFRYIGNTNAILSI